MNQPNPDWYEDLIGNPLREKAFTNEMAAQVKDRVMSASASPGLFLIRGRSQKGLALCIAGLLTLSLILYLPLDRLFDSNVHRTSSVPATQQASSILTPVVEPEWQTRITQHNPNIPKEMLYKDSYNDQVTFIFWKASYGEGSTQLGVDYFTRASADEDWKANGLITFSPNESDIIPAEGFNTGWFGFETIPLFVGHILEPKITGIQITDEQGVSRQATLIRGKDGQVYWFAALSHNQQSFSVAGMDTEGRLGTANSFYAP